MNNENFKGQKGEPWTPIMIIMGVRTKLGVLWKMKKKFKRCLKDVLILSVFT